ncbi:hypothetical protein CROQUDRAFT_656155 [Cronartium quercuum f. sp. fusiforme G11]|uniref:Uncharacterized protein n=1 Tax=Cronartium quercuum f. sp. fusiforme G11 TaxID=708437 RepID=A0A9P6NNQ7_9BASI|nr:hypothetical protein CROQUDRAFT_656155 [Cronartium quercuum f. sp. fusiforme G11]
MSSFKFRRVFTSWDSRPKVNSEKYKISLLIVLLPILTPNSHRIPPITPNQAFKFPLTSRFLPSLITHLLSLNLTSPASN